MCIYTYEIELYIDTHVFTDSPDLHLGWFWQSSSWKRYQYTERRNRNLEDLTICSIDRKVLQVLCELLQKDMARLEGVYSDHKIAAIRKPTAVIVAHVHLQNKLKQTANSTPKALDEKTCKLSSLSPTPPPSACLAPWKAG